MTQIESPKRKMQKKNDYLRHKLFRKIKRRNKAQAQADLEIAEKLLKKKLKLPKFGRGNDGNEIYKSDVHINEDGTITDVRTGKNYDGARIPEVVATARRIPTFKDIEKQIGRKITQDEIDKVVAVDPEVPLQLPNAPKEKGAVLPSITNEIINTAFGTIGDAANKVSNAAGFGNVAPNELLFETRDGDALFDLPGYGQAAKIGLYGIGRYGGKLGLKKLLGLARLKLLEREFFNSKINSELAKEIVLKSETINPRILNKVGDVEINNPELNYRQVSGDAINNYKETGSQFGKVLTKPNEGKISLILKLPLSNPMYMKGGLWYGEDAAKRNYPGLFVSSKDLPIANKHAYKVRNDGIATSKNGVTKVNGLGGRRINDVDNPGDLGVYLYEDGYGYRKIQNGGKIAKFEVPKTKAQLRIPNSDYDLLNTVNNVELPENINPLHIAHNNSLIVRPDGTIDMRNLVRARQQLRLLYPEANNPKEIFNHDFLTGKRTNLNQHTEGVVKTAQDIPVPIGYSRQDLVLAALGHDIGKVIDPRQGLHELISADMLVNAIKQNGFIGTQDIKPDVIKAIAEHGFGNKAVELDPLTQALHVADVTRGATYDQAAIHAGYLFNYPREYPKWNFLNKPLHDEIVLNINPALKRLGYETINPNSTLNEAKDELNSIIDLHRTFVRGIYDKEDAKALSYMLTNEPISSKEANGGRRGWNGYRKFYGYPLKKYDGLYLSTNAEFLDTYGNGGVGGKVGVVRIPLNEVSKTSDSLSERLLAGDFDVYNSNQIRPGRAGSPQSNWTLFGLPYRLLTGRSLRSDMIEKDPNVPKINSEYIKGSGLVLTHMKPTDIQRNKILVGNIGEDQPTYGLMVDEINKSLEGAGLTKIKSFATTDKNGEVENIFFNNGQGIERIYKIIDKLKDLEWYGEMIRPYIKDERKIRNRLNLLRDEYLSHWDRSPELVDEIEKLEYEVSLIDGFRSSLDMLPYLYSSKQIKAVKHSGDLKYIKRSTLKMALDDYFDGVKKLKGHIRHNAKDQEIYLNNPENLAAFMRSQGVLPRYDHPTYNHVLTITPGLHIEDMPLKMSTKNKPLGPGLIAVIGKRGDKVVDLVHELTPNEIKDIREKTDAAKVKLILLKPSGKKPYKDSGGRIRGLKLSRKTLL